MQRFCSSGSISALVDSADGTLDAKYEYAAFGETLRVGGTAIADDNPFRFSTKYLDSDGARKRVDGDAEGVARRAEEAGAPWALMRQSGLIYYGFRYYSPSLGRVLNRDPIGELGGTNLYGFVENDPVNGWDYLGLDDELICTPEEYMEGLRDNEYRHNWRVDRMRREAEESRARALELAVDLELLRMEGGCIEGGCPKETVQQKPLEEEQPPQDDSPVSGPSILEQNNGPSRGDRVIDPTGEKPGILERFWNWLNRPPETESEKAIMDFGAGFGDSMTFGLSEKVRQVIGTDENVDYESDAYKRGQQAEGYTPRGLGKKLSLKLGIKKGARKTLTNSQRKAIRSLNKTIAKHQKKLKAYKANLDAFDNKGFLKNAKSPEIRRRIIEGRIRLLKWQISNFEKRIEDII